MVSRAAEPQLVIERRQLSLCTHDLYLMVQLVCHRSVSVSPIVMVLTLIVVLQTHSVGARILGAIVAKYQLVGCARAANNEVVGAATTGKPNWRS